MNGLPAASFSMTGLRCFTACWAHSVPVDATIPATKIIISGNAMRKLRFTSAMFFLLEVWMKPLLGSLIGAEEAPRTIPLVRRQFHGSRYRARPRHPVE